MDESEVRAVCKNCDFSMVIGYYNDVDFLWIIDPSERDSIYDGVCPECNSELNIRILDLEKEGE